ncbi:hypothetical protein ACW9UR_19290 [Halovulum sp. GXIMD14794]
MYGTNLDELHTDNNRADYPAPAGEGDTPPTNTTPHKLAAGEAINRWLYTNPSIEHWEGEMRPTVDKVDYRFLAAVTGLSPARDKLDARGPLTDTAVPAGPFEHLYVNSSSPNVDFSLFAYVPLLIRRALRCRLHTGEGGRARFRLTACGAIRLWLGDELVESFAPWSFNYESSREVELDLPAGDVDLTVELEDLHERNTVNYFAVTWISGAEVSYSVPAADPERLEDAMAVIDGLDFDRVYFDGGPLSLGLEQPPRFGLPVEVVSLGQAARNHSYEWLDTPPITLTLEPGASTVTFPDVETLPTGCSEVTICARVGDVRIPKRLGTTILTRAIPLHGRDVAARKAEVLRHTLNDTGSEISVAMVHLAQGVCSDRTRRVLEEGLRLIESRHDCSDFAYLAALRIWRDYRGTLPEDLEVRLERALLGFRFWVTEPGNDAMWFWSENHILCFHISQYIAGHLFPDRRFPNSGRLGETHEAEARQRLYRWFESIESFGLCEWNSAAYYPIDMFALLALHDLSPDEVLKQKAKQLLDRIFVMTGLHTTGGVPAGTQGRSYEKELLPGPINELAVTAAIAFGGTYYPAQGRAAFSFCLSDYEPPEAAARFARPARGELIEARYHQGFRQHGKLTLWKTDQVQLSTVSDHMTGTRGAQQHVIDVQFAGNPMARLWINHPGDRKPWSERRPSRLAGNHWLPRVAQHGGTALMIYDVPEDDRYIPHSQLFAITPAFDELWQCEKGVLLRSGQACASIWCSEPLEVETRGAYRGAIFRANARRTAWVVSLETDVSEADVARLQERLQNDALDFDREALRLGYGAYALDYRSGHFTKDGQELRQDFGSPVPFVSVNGGEFAEWNKLR